ELERANPGGWLAVIPRTGGTCNQEHDGADDCKADHPADYERGAIGAASCAYEQKYDGDDWERTQCDTDGSRQYLPNRSTHQPEYLFLAWGAPQWRADRLDKYLVADTGGRGQSPLVRVAPPIPAGVIGACALWPSGQAACVPCW